MTVSAADAGKAMLTVADRLYDVQVLAPEGYVVLERVARELQRRKSAQSWTIEVDRGQPINFAKVQDRSGRIIAPAIVAKGIVVSQGDRYTPPFDQLDMALEILDDRNMPVARWHLDLANRGADGLFQAGPLIHLQYGGHHHGARELDAPLKAPRWCHPPMELALLCEVVAANFYEDAWAKLRDDPNWCRAIGLYQRLCYSTYLEKLSRCLSVSSSTALNVMWASAWGAGAI